MWNNRPSLFLLIKVRHRSLHLALPVALYVVDDLFQSLGDLAALAEWLFPRLRLPGLAAAAALAGWRELRRLGRWRLLEVADKDLQISLSFH